MSIDTAAGSRQQADTERRTLRNYIGGGWVEAAGDETLEDATRRPASSRRWSRSRGAADVDAAVRAAREAQPAWRGGGPAEARPRRDGAARGALGAPARTSPASSPRTWARRSTTPAARSCAGSSRPRRPAGSRTCSRARTSRASRGGVDVELVRQPVGVVAAITPFNFPAMIPLWFLPYRDRLRQHVHPQAVRARPAPVGADLRADRRDRRDPRRRAQPRPRRPRRRQRAARPSRRSTRSRSSARRRPRATSPSARRPTGKRFQALGGAKNSLVVMPDADLEVTVPAIMSLGLRRRRASAASRARSRCSSAAARRQDEVARRARATPPPELGVGPGDAGGGRGLPAGRAGGARPDRGRDRGAPPTGGDEVVLDGRARRRGPGGTLIGPSIVATDRARVRARPRGALRPAARGRPRRRPRRGARVRQRLALRQRRLDLHHLGRRRARLPLRRRGRDARRQRRRRRARSPGSRSRAGRTRSTATCTPTARDAVEFYTRKKVVTSRW